MELILLWACSRLSDVEVEPDWWPDEKLYRLHPACRLALERLP